MTSSDGFLTLLTCPSCIGAMLYLLPARSDFTRFGIVKNLWQWTETEL